jgi:hypothetical protein
MKTREELERKQVEKELTLLIEATIRLERELEEVINDGE